MSFLYPGAINMKYLIVTLFFIFPVFSFAAEGEPDPVLVQKAEAGDIDSIVQLYGFYEKKGDPDKANDFLRKAAEKGHIPSLKLIYQQTGEILSTGVEIVINSRLRAFAPLRGSGLGNTDLLHFNRLDYLSSERGLAESAVEIRKAVIYEITDGQKNTLEASAENTSPSSKNKDSDKGGDPPPRPPSRPIITELKEGAFQEVDSQRGEHTSEIHRQNRSFSPSNAVETELTSLETLETYMVHRLEQNQENMNTWLGKLKGFAKRGDMLALQMVYRITGEVISEGYTKVVNTTMDSFFEADREKGIHPKVTAMQNLREVQNSVMERIKTPFVKGKEGIMLELHEIYRRAVDTEQMTFWLNKLREVANKGNTMALKVFYHITNEVLSSGVNAAVAHQVKSAPQEEIWIHPKMEYMWNRGQALENTMKFITSPLRYVRCPGAF